jgi:hypothetical protein
MNTFAALYAFSKLEGLYKKKMGAIKDGLLDVYFDNPPSVLERHFRHEVSSLPAGYYKINFGGVSSPVFLDGMNYGIIYGRMEREEQNKTSFKDKDGLLAALGKTKKDDMSYQDIIKGMEEAMPGIVRSCQLEVNASESVQAVRTKDSPLIVDAIDCIGSEYHEKICKSSIELLTKNFSIDLYAFDAVKKQNKEIVELKKYFALVCSQSFEPNIYIKKSLSSRLSCDSESLDKYCKEHAETVAAFVNLKKENKEDLSSSASYTIKWAGLSSDLTGNITSDVLDVLDTIHMQSKSRGGNEPPIFFQNAAAGEPQKPSRLNM